MVQNLHQEKYTMIKSGSLIKLDKKILTSSVNYSIHFIKRQYYRVT